MDTWESRTRNKEEKVKGLRKYTKDLLENSDEEKFLLKSLTELGNMDESSKIVCKRTRTISK